MELAVAWVDVGGIPLTGSSLKRMKRGLPWTMRHLLAKGHPKGAVGPVPWKLLHGVNVWAECGLCQGIPRRGPQTASIVMVASVSGYVPRHPVRPNGV